MADPARVFAASEQERDRITPAARKALWGSALGYAMDGFDLLILGFMLRAISADLGLSPAQAASLVTATLVGAVIGGVGNRLMSKKIIENARAAFGPAPARWRQTLLVLPEARDSKLSAD